MIEIILTVNTLFDTSNTTLTMTDARARFFNGMERQIAENCGDAEGQEDDIDIEFNLTQSGGTLTNLEGTRDMEVSNSIRTSDSLNFTESERDDLIKTLQCDPVVPQNKNVIRQTSAAKARPIPVPQGQPSAVQPQSQASSQGSSGSAFLSSVLNPTASTFNNTQLSHTPPTLGSSYETSHFGKRARSGSVSGRLRAASEYLEERGLLDRQTKGILKDLIIIGDEELQRAIDSYESGDPSALEEMIKSGALQNRLPSDLDILDDLDLDFLTIEGVDGDVGAGRNIESVQSVPANNQAACLPVHAASNATFQQDQRPTNMVSPQYNDDGIGDLEFAGDLVSNNAVCLQLDPQPADAKEPPVATSPADTSSNLSEYEQRMRSNSLFSALLNDTRAQPKRVGNQSGGTSNESQYGRWMDRSTDGSAAAPSGTKTGRGNPTASTPAAPSGIAASLEAERKRHEKQTKKEMREKAKQEKKEKGQVRKRLAAEEEQVHVPGSGMPRSLSDPNFQRSLDQDGLTHVERPDGWVGAYSPDSRKVRIERFLQKRNHRVWTKTVKYDVRKNFADSRLRVKGRFVKKEDEVLMRELMSLT